MVSSSFREEDIVIHIGWTAEEEDSFIGTCDQVVRGLYFAANGFEFNTFLGQYVVSLHRTFYLLLAPELTLFTCLAGQLTFIG